MHNHSTKTLFAAALSLAIGLVTAHAQNFTYASFDMDVEGWGGGCGGWDDNGATHVATLDNSIDAATNAASGSMMLDVTFPATGNGAAHYQTCKGMSDITPYKAVSIDIYVPGTTARSPNGDFGRLDLRLRTGNWDWPGVLIDFGRITNTGWTHIETPIPTTSATNFVGANLEWAASYTSQAAIWVDQIVFLVPEKILAFSTWDTDVQGWDCNGWNDDGVSVSTSWDSSVDADNKTTSGSLRVDGTFSKAGAVHLQTCKGVSDFSPYKSMSVQIYVAPDTPLSPAGNYGTFDVRLRTGNWDWPGVVVSLGTVTSTGWTKLRAAIPSTTATNFAGANLEWAATYADAGQVITVWVDNLYFIGESVAEPAPAMSIAKSEPGLEIVTSGTGDYSRRNVATVGDMASLLPWINYANPVTYSMTVNESVGPGAANDSDGYALNIMLSPTADASINASPDWNQAHGLFMEATATTKGTLNIDVRYKTNAPNSHGIRNTPEGLILQTNSALTSLVGTWALTLSSNLVIVTAPGGVTAHGYLPSDVPALFGPNLFALFGAQPNTFKDRRISLSRVHIYGGADFAGTVDQTFTTATNLDSAFLELKEEDPGGIHLKPTNTVWRVSWTIPDVGFSLYGAPALTGASWTPITMAPVNVGLFKATYLTPAEVSDQRNFFRLKK